MPLSHYTLLYALASKRYSTLCVADAGLGASGHTMRRGAGRRTNSKREVKREVLLTVVNTGSVRVDMATSAAQAVFRVRTGHSDLPMVVGDTE